jgi:hypothetical protein
VGNKRLNWIESCFINVYIHKYPYIFIMYIFINIYPKININIFLNNDYWLFKESSISLVSDKYITSWFPIGVSPVGDTPIPSWPRTRESFYESTWSSISVIGSKKKELNSSFFSFSIESFSDIKSQLTLKVLDISGVTNIWRNCKTTTLPPDDRAWRETNINAFSYRASLSREPLSFVGKPIFKYHFNLLWIST